MDLNDLLAEVDGIGGDAYVATETPVLPLDEEAMAHDAGLASTPASPTPATHSTALIAERSHTETFDVAMDVGLELAVELGQASITLETLLRLSPGDRLAVERRPDEQLKIYAGERLIAVGEPLIVDGKLAIKVTELLVGDEDTGAMP